MHNHMVVIRQIKHSSNSGSAGHSWWMTIRCCPAFYHAWPIETFRDSVQDGNCRFPPCSGPQCLLGLSLPLHSCVWHVQKTRSGSQVHSMQLKCHQELITPASIRRLNYSMDFVLQRFSHVPLLLHFWPKPKSPIRYHPSAFSQLRFPFLFLLRAMLLFIS